MKHVGILLLLGTSLFAQDNISYVDPAAARSHQDGFPLWALATTGDGKTVACAICHR